MSNPTTETYEQIAKEARKKVLEMIYSAQTSHIGSNFSCIDILTVLFEKADLPKDKILLSAGWKAAAFYYFLARKGIIPAEDLGTYCREGSKYIGLTEPSVPGVHFAGGSMGLGFPAAVGFALAKKMSKEDGTVYVLMSDGELQIGTTWESALIAGQHALDNLVVLIDDNGLQAMGRTEHILKDANFPVMDRWHYAGFINGHDYEEIEQSLATLHETAPMVISYGTVKGKGVSIFEDNNLFHYKAPSEEEYQLAMKELL